ncbi:hypothetical protein KC326_g62 [Hortaea werneckii]|nr:hypothetical protein KC326_g62 [Hortaea werneckii]
MSSGIASWGQDVLCASGIISLTPSAEPPETSNAARCGGILRLPRTYCTFRQHVPGTSLGWVTAYGNFVI